MSERPISHEGIRGSLACFHRTPPAKAWIAPDPPTTPKATPCPRVSLTVIFISAALHRYNLNLEPAPQSTLYFSQEARIDLPTLKFDFGFQRNYRADENCSRKIRIWCSENKASKTERIIIINKKTFLFIFAIFSFVLPATHLNPGPLSSHQLIKITCLTV